VFSWLGSLKWTNVERLLALLATLCVVGGIGYFGWQQSGGGAFDGELPWSREDTLTKTRRLNPLLDIQEGTSGRRAKVSFLDIHEPSTRRKVRIHSSFAGGRRLAFVTCPAVLPAPSGAEDPICIEWTDQWGRTTALGFRYGNSDAVAAFYEELSMSGRRAVHLLDDHAVVLLLPVESSGS
jgi:hypothetical protein